MANWSEFDHDLLVKIASQIPSIFDFISFPKVSWRSAADEKIFRYNSPLFMLVPVKLSHMKTFKDWNRHHIIKLFKVMVISGEHFFEYLCIVESAESAGPLWMVLRTGVQIRPIEEDSEVCDYGTTGFQVFWG
ncbi:hypothetical protein Pint_34546 [Pistacia integerrima]|uniref:Uncharacterized protein n=1 Tax=Pistacia integerrima TaxID=434235 RepID=A0ACC0X830_9ROSI|nr:hypothetical protein Pint_34546 [Pistacia integerrima]